MVRVNPRQVFRQKRIIIELWLNKKTQPIDWVFLFNIIYAFTFVSDELAFRNSNPELSHAKMKNALMANIPN